MPVEKKSCQHFHENSSESSLKYNPQLLLIELSFGYHSVKRSIVANYRSLTGWTSSYRCELWLHDWVHAQVLKDFPSLRHRTSKSGAYPEYYRNDFWHSRWPIGTNLSVAFDLILVESEQKMLHCHKVGPVLLGFDLNHQAADPPDKRAAAGSLKATAAET